MIEQLDELYREVILDHFKNSSHHGEIPDAQIKVNGANPLCGDELTFYMKLRNGHIQKVRFDGKGCAISQAAASMLATQLEDHTINEAKQVIDTMKALMQGEEPNPSVDLGIWSRSLACASFPCASNAPPYHGTSSNEGFGST